MIPPVHALCVIPAYNEERAIGSVLSALRNGSPELDILVVDDGSTDGTAAVAEAEGAQVLRLPYNLGIGGARQAGYIFAERHGYRVVVQFDADGQHLKHQINALVSTLAEQDLDMVIGSRFIEKKGDLSSPSRRAGGRLLSVILKLVCGLWITDPTSGLRVAGQRAILLFAADYPDDYPEVESIALLSRYGLRVGEKSTIMDRRIAGNSSISIMDSMYYMVKVVIGLCVYSLAPSDSGLQSRLARAMVDSGDQRACNSETRCDGHLNVD